jgi:hypothetical protein
VLQAFPASRGFAGRGSGNGQPTSVLTLQTTADAPAPVPLPTVLSSLGRVDPGRATVVRDISLARSGRGFSINGQTMTSMDDMMDTDRTMRVQVGDTELWRVQNGSGATHLFHVHDVQFQIVDRNGVPPNPNEAGWKDTVMVHPNERNSPHYHDLRRLRGRRGPVHVPLPHPRARGRRHDGPIHRRPPWRVNRPRSTDPRPQQLESSLRLPWAEPECSGALVAHQALASANRAQVRDQDIHSDGS